jgi:hypothetical protein
MPDRSRIEPALSSAHDGKAIWKWDHGEATGCDELGAPDLDTAYEVCIFDQTGSGSYALASDFHVPAGASWRFDERGDECGWTYRDKTLAADGVKRFALESGVDGRSSIVLSAIGPRASVPEPAGESRFLHFQSSAVVQVFGDTGVCWESSFSEASKNDGSKFRATRKVRP